ncbi:MAG: threonine/serine dehydratase [Myxococcota bacterium]
MVSVDDIREARRALVDALDATPLLRSSGLEERLGHPVRLKCELFQRTGSFKPRGALNWVCHASRAQLERGLVTVSAGNHAQALAWAARAVGAPVTVVMPSDASPMKVEACRRYGAEVVLHGRIDDATAHMQVLRKERGLVLVHPYDEPRVIAGQGTVGLEITEQLPDVDLVVVPVGGGGLVSGIAMAVKAARPGARVIGVEPEGAATMRYAWDRGGPTPLPSVRTVASSLGALSAGEHTYALTRQWVDDLVTLDEDAILTGLHVTLTSAKLYAEPGGAIAVAALLAGRVPVRRGEQVVAVVSGGNLDLSKLRGLI